MALIKRRDDSIPHWIFCRLSLRRRNQAGSDRNGEEINKQLVYYREARRQRPGQLLRGFSRSHISIFMVWESKARRADTVSQS